MKKPFVVLSVLTVVLLVVFSASAGATTLKLAMDADPVSLDPQVQLSGGMLQYSHMVFDPLVRWTRDGKFEPRLAVKWESVNDTTTGGVAYSNTPPLLVQRMAPRSSSHS